MSDMQESLNSFCEALGLVESTLAKHKNEALSRAGQVFEVLQETDKKLSEAARVKAGASGLQKQMGESLKLLKSSIGACEKKLEEKSRIRQELENVDEKARAIVLVFGRTNAGKSTLGNFLRGKSLLEASFDNPWKNGAIKPGPITVVKSADGKQADSRDWFKEGSTETTQEIQCFTLPGLLWVDTPGIGSVNDETLGELARKYADNADLVIYLDHSDNPGLSSNATALVKLLEQGQETLAIINQSDKTGPLLKGADGNALFENGKPKKSRIPKPEEDRRAQEKQLIKSIHDAGFNTAGKLSAISISMLLANQAVEKADNILYEGSALGKFLEKLQSIFISPEKIRQLMAGHLYSACLDLCNMSLKGPEKDIPGLSNQLETQQAFLREIEKQETNFDVEAETSAISTKIALDASTEIRRILDGVKTGKRKNIDLDLSPLVSRVQERCNQLVSEKITSVVKALFESVEFKNIVIEASRFEGIRMERRTETHEYEVPTAVRVERDASGIIETVKSWFGKRYYRVERGTAKKTLQIDLGFNLEETRAKIDSMLADAIPKTVQDSLNDAKRQTLGYAREKVAETISILKGAERRINLIKGDIEREIEKSGALACSS